MALNPEFIKHLESGYLIRFLKNIENHIEKDTYKKYKDPDADKITHKDFKIKIEQLAFLKEIYETIEPSLYYFTEYKYDFKKRASLFNELKIYMSAEEFNYLYELLKYFQMYVPIKYGFWRTKYFSNEFYQEEEKKALESFFNQVKKYNKEVDEKVDRKYRIYYKSYIKNIENYQEKIATDNKIPNFNNFYTGENINDNELKNIFKMANSIQFLKKEIDSDYSQNIYLNKKKFGNLDISDKSFFNIKKFNNNTFKNNQDNILDEIMEISMKSNYLLNISNSMEKEMNFSFNYIYNIIQKDVIFLSREETEILYEDVLKLAPVFAFLLTSINDKCARYEIGQKIVKPLGYILNYDKYEENINNLMYKGSDPSSLNSFDIFKSSKEISKYMNKNKESLNVIESQFDPNNYSKEHAEEGHIFPIENNYKHQKIKEKIEEENSLLGLFETFKSFINNYYLNFHELNINDRINKITKIGYLRPILIFSNNSTSIINLLEGLDKSIKNGDKNIIDKISKHLENFSGDDLNTRNKILQSQKNTREKILDQNNENSEDFEFDFTF